MAPPDPDAWWSPVPGGPPVPDAGPPYAGFEHAGSEHAGFDQPYTQPYPADGPARAAPAYGPGPVAPGPRLADGPRRSRRRLLPAVTAGVLVLVLGGALGVRAVTSATKVLHDGARTLSVTVPRSWFDNTGEPGTDPDVPPVLAASNLWQSQRIEVDRFGVEEGDTLASFHAEGVDAECAQWSCTSRTAPERLSVAGHLALEQVVTHPADADGGASTSLTLTVWLDGRAVEVYGLATSSGTTAPDATTLRRVAASLELL